MSREIDGNYFCRSIAQADGKSSVTRTYIAFSNCDIVNRNRRTRIVIGDIDGADIAVTNEVVTARREGEDRCFRRITFKDLVIDNGEIDQSCRSTSGKGRSTTHWLIVTPHSCGTSECVSDGERRGNYTSSGEGIDTIRTTFDQIGFGDADIDAIIIVENRASCAATIDTGCIFGIGKIDSKCFIAFNLDIANDGDVHDLANLSWGKGDSASSGGVVITRNCRCTISSSVINGDCFNRRVAEGGCKCGVTGASITFGFTSVGNTNRRAKIVVGNIDGTCINTDRIIATRSDGENHTLRCCTFK